MYIIVMEKALKKKQREEEASKAGTKKNKTIKPSSSLETADEASTSATPPQLTLNQMVRLGQESGFDEVEEGELREASQEDDDE